MIAAIVIPCLNEQASLLSACKSLGFGTGSSSMPSDTYLCIVDNGSTDNTLTIAEQVQRASPKGSVIIGHEPDRGYVPPRHHGNLLIKELAITNGWDENEVLILQADADTYYSDGYVHNMRVAAIALPTGVVLEACSEYPTEFVMTHIQYIEMCRSVDHAIQHLLVATKYDVVVDDKVCAYRLGDYFKWGGHIREYTLAGEEIYAETTRLYLRAVSRHGCRYLVADAVAQHSVRKVLADPVLDFVTAGFPREDSWRTEWHQQYQGPIKLDELYKATDNIEVQKAVAVRQLHILALFGILPLHIANTLNLPVENHITAFGYEMLSILPQRNRSLLLSQPGIFIMDVLSLLEYREDILLQYIAKQYN